MATVESALYDRLVAFSGLSALVGTRVYPNVLPQNVTYPAVSYRRVSAERPSAMGSDSGIVLARMQIDSWAADTASKSGYKAARDTANQVRLALQRWRKTSDPVIEDCFILTEIELSEPDAVRQIHHVAIDVQVIYRE